MYNSRVKAALIAAALLAVWGAIENFQLENASNIRDPYMVEAQVDRLAGVVQMVKPDAIVGYVSDMHDGSTVAQAMFNATRYALAPRLLVDATDRDVVVGSFAKPADYAALAAEHGLRVERDFGNGVVLFRKAGQ